MKKLLSFALVLVLLFGLVPATFAQENVNLNSSQHTKFNSEDVLSLEKYISVNGHGFFEMNSAQAENDGVNPELIVGQLNFLNLLNTQIANKELVAYPDLSVKNARGVGKASDNSVTSSSCNGVTTEVEHHWWGYSRLFNSCDANEVAADFASAAAVSTGVAVVAAYFGGAPAVPAGLSAAYFALLSSRIYANNANNTGVYLGMTWVYVFDVEPQ